MNIEAAKGAAPERPSVGVLSAPLVERLVEDARSLRLGVEVRPGGARLVDAGIAVPGGIEAGRRITEICMGGLGRVSLEAGGGDEAWPFKILVGAASPVLACLASQYAGWSLNHEGEGGANYFAMASGPGRACAAKEALFEEIDYRDDATGRAAFVLETDKAPPDALIASVARDCGLAEKDLTFILTPTQSLAGGVQIVGRVLEVALHKVHTLGFPLDRIFDGQASAPLAPPAPDMLVAMGRTNDAILFGGVAHLYVSGPEGEAEELAAKMPASTSRDYGQPFAQAFQAAGYDFYKIDPLLFSPARVIVTALETGRSFKAGKLDPALLARSFDGE